MTSRERFLKTMRNEKTDRVPYFEEGIRKDVIKAWRKQGLTQKAELSKMFSTDRHEEIEVDLEPRPKLRKWPTSRNELKVLRKSLNPNDSRRLPRNWSSRVRTWQRRDHVLMLRVHRGFFLSMGVYDWHRFSEVIRLLIETVVLRTFANARILIPSILKWGFNCLWACEVNIEAMDYRDLRREFGTELRLIGGIDLDALRGDKEAIRREVEGKVPPLLAEGGYVPLADGRVRADVPFENYVYYRRLLEKVTREAGAGP
ncbi:MAG: hypothetical protein P8012_13370 [Desulfobacterales bacterium]